MENNTWKMWEEVVLDQLKNQVMTQVWGQVGESVLTQIWDQVKDKTEKCV